MIIMFMFIMMILFLFVCFVGSDVLSEEMTKACVIYAQWLVDASKVSEDDKVKYTDL